ncbi:MAG: hypothetical protein LBT41_01950 [Candidatus Methanoplasma sp.]|jgi:RNase P/RNase MRP subunit POP5|nr:hypothetical protein [Candidatus Methanoplasma sp.]
MVVKSERGRRRYVVFGVSAGLTRSMLINRLRGVCPEDEVPYVVQCVPGKAVIRCAPKEIDRTIAAVAAADRASEPLLTSGTLRTLRERYPDLKTPGKRS